MTKKLVEISDKLSEIYEELKEIKGQLLDIILSVDNNKKYAKTIVNELVEAIIEIEDALPNIGFADIRVLNAHDYIMEGGEE